MSLSLLKLHLENLENFLQSHKNYGTLDTEVRNKKTTLLQQAAKLQKVVVPQTPAGWEIYADMENADAVALNLYMLVTRLVETISGLTVSEYKSEEFKTAFRDYL